MGCEVAPLQLQWLTSLSRFLTVGFDVPEGSLFADEEVMRWKYFDRYGTFPHPRSWVAREHEGIVAHAGVCPTSFTRTASSAAPVPALSVIDWLTGSRDSPVGAMLMLRVLRLAEIQYTLGCSLAADRVLRKLGYRVISQVPLFQQVLRAPAWALLHRQQPAWKRAALTAVDLVHSLGGWFRSTPSVVTLESAPQFDERAATLLNGWRTPFWHSERSPELLNHFLRFPHGRLSGWWLVQDHQVIGFALLSRVERDALSIGKIVDCLLDPAKADAWAASIGALTRELRRQGCAVAVCYGSTPWMAHALSANGYFRRGRTPFYLRDPQGKLSLDCPIHLTHLEGDLAYLP